MYKLFSRRQEELKGEIQDVFEYDNIPQEFRNQVFYILDGIFSEYSKADSTDLWELIRNRFLREKGWKSLHDIRRTYKSETENFFLAASNSDMLDYIDYVFNLIDVVLRVNPPRYYSDDISVVIDRAITELNERLKYHCLGYEFVNRELIRIDNEVIHKNTIKPSLQLLYIHEFSGANEEILKAYDFRRKSDNKHAIAEANKAFESTIKTICDKIGYTYDPAKSTAKDLIKILEDNQFYPSYLNNHITGIRVTLESGLPTVRNKTSGHGQGAAVIPIPDEYADYALNLVAVNILFLMKIYENKIANKDA